MFFISLTHHHSVCHHLHLRNMNGLLWMIETYDVIPVVVLSKSLHHSVQGHFLVGSFLLAWDLLYSWSLCSATASFTLVTAIWSEIVFNFSSSLWSFSSYIVMPYAMISWFCILAVTAKAIWSHLIWEIVLSKILYWSVNCLSLDAKCSTSFVKACWLIETPVECVNDLVAMMNNEIWKTFNYTCCKDNIGLACFPWPQIAMWSIG